MANLKVKDGVSSSSYGDNILAQVGMIMPYAGTTAPSGWLICDGSTFSSTTYPQLYTLLGNSTTLPNLREKYLLGYDSAASSRTLGSTITSTHNHSITYPANNPTNAVAFVTNSPSFTHSHTINYNGIADGSHAHTHSWSYNFTAGGSVNYQSNTGNYSQATPTNVAVSLSNHTHNAGGSTNYADNGNHGHTASSNGANNAAPSHAHNFTTTGAVAGTLANSSSNTIPETIYINFIIKAG